MNFFSKWFTKSNKKKDAKFQDIEKDIANNPELKKMYMIMQLTAQGIRLGQQEKFDESIDILRKAIKIDPHSEIAPYIQLAMAYRGKNMVDEALEILHQVEKKDSSLMDFDLFFTLATIYIRKDDKFNAVKYAKKAIEAHENPKTKESIEQAEKYGVINSGELNREPMIEGLKELIAEWENKK